MMKKYLIFSIILVFFGRSMAQDLHYTQFYNTPINFNPSLTGIYNGDQRYMVSVRDQWRAVPIPYFTLTGSYDMKFYPTQLRKSFFSAGLVFNYDLQGDAALNLSNLNLAGSFSYVISSRNLITVGGLVGISSRGFSDKNLTWDAQYDPLTSSYDDRRPSNEILERYRFNYLETGLGLNYRWQKNSRFHITIGAAGFHLNKPVQDFHEGVETARQARLESRYALHGVVNLKIASPLDLQLNALYQSQHVYQELVLGGLLKVFLNQQRGKMFEFHLGAFTRFNENYWTGTATDRFMDAVIPTVAVQYNDWYVGFNYDITLSPLGALDDINHRGGPELHISYIFKSVQPLKAFKFCPIF